MSQTKQRSLYEWFPVKHCTKAELIVPSLLYLHCNQHTFIGARWYFPKYAPLPITREYKIQWNIEGRNGSPVDITVACGNIPADTHKCMCNDGHSLPHVSHNAHTIPFLKSHLQKCVRKGTAGLAVQTCKELLQLDVLQVVRRLSIIMVEDVDLHPSFNVLLWWTIVLSKDSAQRKQNGLSKHIKACDVPRCLIEWLLGLSHLLCEYKHRRYFDLHPQTSTVWESMQECHEYISKNNSTTSSA